MHMTNKCECLGCNNPVKIKERFKVLDENFNMYTFKVSLCVKCYEMIHNVKEKIVGDFSVFFDEPLKKRY